MSFSLGIITCNFHFLFSILPKRATLTGSVDDAEGAQSGDSVLPEAAIFSRLNCSILRCMLGGVFGMMRGE